MLVHFPVSGPQAQLHPITESHHSWRASRKDEKIASRGDYASLGEKVYLQAGSCSCRKYILCDIWELVSHNNFLAYIKPVWIFNINLPVFILFPS